MDKIQLDLSVALEWVLLGIKNGNTEAAKKLLEDIIAECKARGL